MRINLCRKSFPSVICLCGLCAYLGSFHFHWFIYCCWLALLASSFDGYLYFFVRENSYLDVAWFILIYGFLWHFFHCLFLGVRLIFWFCFLTILIVRWWSATSSDWVLGLCCWNFSLVCCGDGGSNLRICYDRWALGFIYVFVNLGG